MLGSIPKQWKSFVILHSQSYPSNIIISIDKVNYSHDVGQRQGPTTIIEAVNIIVCLIMYTATLMEACVVVTVLSLIHI